MNESAPSPTEPRASAMTRRCSHCGHNGHNSRTCPDRGVRLFGVRLGDNFMRKSVSTGNLNHYNSNSPSTPEQSDNGANLDGYVSDGCGQTSSNIKERKKGVPWTEEEHRLFLIGLNKLGKGDWRGISRNFVQTRTPTQVASHAQKYFIRQNNLNKRKRRSSLFDIGTDSNFVKGLGRSMSTPSLPTLTEDAEPPDSPLLAGSRPQINSEQNPNQQQRHQPSLLHPPQPGHFQLPPPYMMPPYFDINCQNYQPGIPHFGIPPYPTHLGVPPYGSLPIHAMPTIGGSNLAMEISRYTKEKHLPVLMEGSSESETPNENDNKTSQMEWSLPMDPALSHRIGYEMMMGRMRIDLPQFVHNNTVADEEDKTSVSQSEEPKEEIASSWQKSDVEKATPHKPTPVSAVKKFSELDQPRFSHRVDDSFYHCQPHMPNPAMFAPFPYQWPAFNHNSTFFNGTMPQIVSYHPGVLRPRPYIPAPPFTSPNKGFSNCDVKSEAGTTPPSVEPSPLTLKLLDGGDRQSAFHPKPNFASTSLNSESLDVAASPISVV